MILIKKISILISNSDSFQTRLTLEDFKFRAACSNPNRAIFEFAVDTRKMLFRYSELCGMAFEAVDAVKSETPQGFEFWKLKLTEFLKKYYKFSFFKI